MDFLHSHIYTVENLEYWIEIERLIILEIKLDLKYEQRF